MCSWMMLPIRDEARIANSRTDSSINIWLYLSIEFLIGAVISGFSTILHVVKSLLPKPPRDLTGDVVLVRTLIFIPISYALNILLQIFPIILKYNIYLYKI